MPGQATRQQFEAALKRVSDTAPEGLSREQFEALVDREANRGVEQVDYEARQPSQSGMLGNAGRNLVDIATSIPGAIGQAVTDTPAFARNLVEGLHSRISGLVGDVHPRTAMDEFGKGFRGEGREHFASGISNLLPVGELYREPVGIAADVAGAVGGAKAIRGGLSKILPERLIRIPPSTPDPLARTSTTGRGGGLVEPPINSGSLRPTTTQGGAMSMDLAEMSKPARSTTGQATPSAIPPSGPLRLNTAPNEAAPIRIPGFGNSTSGASRTGFSTPRSAPREVPMRVSPETPTTLNPDDVLFNEIEGSLRNGGVKVSGGADTGPAPSPAPVNANPQFERPDTAAQPIAASGPKDMSNVETVGGGPVLPGPASMPDLPPANINPGGAGSWNEAIPNRGMADYLGRIFRDEAGAGRVHEPLAGAFQKLLEDERGGTFEVTGHRKPMPSDSQIQPISKDPYALSKSPTMDRRNFIYRASGRPRKLAVDEINKAVDPHFEDVRNAVSPEIEGLMGVTEDTVSPQLLSDIKPHFEEYTNRMLGTKKLNDRYQVIDDDVLAEAAPHQGWDAMVSDRGQYLDASSFANDLFDDVGRARFQEAMEFDAALGTKANRILDAEDYVSPSDTSPSPLVEGLKKRLSMKQRMKDETGAVGPGADRMMRQRAASRDLDAAQGHSPDDYTSRLRDSRLAINDKDWESGATSDAERASAHLQHRELADMDKRFNHLVDDESGSVPAGLAISLARALASEMLRGTGSAVKSKVSRTGSLFGNVANRTGRIGATIQLGAEDR